MVRRTFAGIWACLNGRHAYIGVYCPILGAYIFRCRRCRAVKASR